jgi:hypothetical protein
MDDKQGWERCIAVVDIESNRLAVELLKSRIARVVDEHKLVDLGYEAYEIVVYIESEVVIITHDKGIPWFVFNAVFGLFRDPAATLEVGPLLEVNLKSIRGLFEHLQLSPLPAR